MYTVNHLPPTDQSSSGEGVRKLEFQLNHRLKAAIEEARDKVHDTCNSLSVCAAQYDRYGSSFIKSSGLRADPLMQLAFQVCPPSLTNHYDKYLFCRSHTIDCMVSWFPVMSLVARQPSGENTLLMCWICSLSHSHPQTWQDRDHPSSHSRGQDLC